MRPTRPLLTAAAALLALCGSTAAAQGRQPAPHPGPGAARAAESLTYVTGAPVDVPWEIRVLRTAKATCPAGQTPTGGGMTTSPKWFRFTISSSYASGRDWIVTGNNEDTLNSGTISATVVCSPNAHHQVFGSPVTVQTLEVAYLHQRCPAGEVPTGGGGRGQSQGMVLQNSLQNLNAWEAAYLNDTGAPRTGEPFVVCSAAPHHLVPGRSGPVTKWGGTGTSWVQCPPGQQVTGGGGAGPGTVLVQSTFENNGWRVTSMNQTNDQQQVAAFAVCTGS
ncbi:hypothetical protein [Streptomyces sp. NPDC089919]|uniref:hypothetical protein n=1 Tax=Streptomyces sp. NPDC089919 TaxID=3155188 RepID=UPI0034169AF0